MSAALRRPPFTGVLLVLLAVLLVVGVLAIGVGTVPIPPRRVLALLASAWSAPLSGPEADT